MLLTSLNILDAIELCQVNTTDRVSKVRFTSEIMKQQTNYMNKTIED